jgi:S-DNA-T family DNA segregation ATPase FtsK/SpoIIIE
MMYERTGAEPQKFLPATIEAALQSGFARVAGVLLCLAAAIGWASLLSWSVNDPSPMHATGGAVRNLLGPFGAAVSDLMLQTVGLATLFALLVPMLWGAELIAVKFIAGFRAKVVLYPAAVLILAAGLSAIPKPAGWPLRHGLGGFFGDALLIAGSGLVGFVVPEKSMLLAGLVFFAAGCGLIVYTAGLSQRALWQLVAVGGRAGVGSLRQTRDEQRDGRREPTLDVTAVMRPPLDDVQERYANLNAHDPVVQPRDDTPAPEMEEAVVWPQSDPDPVEVGVVVVDEALDDDAGDMDVDAAALARRFAPGAKKPEARGGLAAILARAAAPEGPVEQPVQLRPAMASNAVRGGYRFPSLQLLKGRDPAARQGANGEALNDTARLLEDVLRDFGVKGEIRDIRPGPVVTVFEFEPQRGTKSQRVIGLAEDIGRSMGARALRISVVPGRNALGIEVPNAASETVLLREILEASAFRASEASLPITLGKSINGEPVVADLARMPHLLVAGTTGSGKSVGINTMIVSLLYRHTHEQCRMLMIDPKMLELSVYNDIPHLLAPVVTDPMQAVAALNWAVGEMEERYKLMAKLGVRNLDGYNKRIREARAAGQPLERCVQTGYHPQTGHAIYETETLDCAPLPYIVIVVDEFADLMLVAGKEIEAAVQRLAQMARAAGIHLIMATQRPSVDVITGTIKANFPSRISFKVASKIDSRTIVNEQGAEQLLGHGDMLFFSGSGALQRVHGAFVSDEEVEAVAAHLRAIQRPDYVAALAEARVETKESQPRIETAAEDLYEQAKAIVIRDRKASTSYLQRRLSIGYNRAADLIDRLEEDGIVSAQNASGRREVLAGNDGSGQLI